MRSAPDFAEPPDDVDEHWAHLELMLTAQEAPGSAAGR
jgi:hypothetical protein